MAVLRIDIERALDELKSQEEGNRFQGLAVTLGKKRWPELIARQRKKDFGLDAYAPATLTNDKIGKGLAASITPTIDKVSDDAKKAKAAFLDLQAFMFVTSAKVGNTDRTAWEQTIRRDYGLDLYLLEREEIITVMMLPENAGLCASHLRIDIKAEPALADLIAKTRRAASNVALTWAAKTKGYPLIELTARRLDRDGADSDEVLGLEDIDQALSQSRRIVLEGPPGCGKTTTLIQLSQRARASGTAFVIELPAWTSSRKGILRFISEMPQCDAEQLSPADLARVHQSEPFFFLLNGWNEVTETNSTQASESLRELERDFPSAGIIVATRPHHLTPPLPGQSVRLRLMPLRRDQRNVYLTVRVGPKSTELRERIERDPSLDELTRSPFILSEVVSLFEAGADIPNTKIGILAAVIRLQEERDEHRNALQIAPVFGRQKDYLQVLATEMTRRGGVSLSESDARSLVAPVARNLFESGQAGQVGAPEVLGALTSHHILVRLDYPDVAYQFEHQQFQEYYAAVGVRARLLELNDADAVARFTSDYVNDAAWDEPLRMIAETLAESGGKNGERNTRAGRELVRMALAVDPVFAGELARLCGGAVWNAVRAEVGERLRAIYALHDDNYRQLAVTAMVATGAEDFADIIGPLLSGPNQQTRLRIHRLYPDLRVTSLGQNWREQVRRWSEEAREEFVSELLHRRADAEIVDFAANDSSAAVKKAAVSSLMWTGPDDALTRVLESMDSQTFESVAREHPDGMPLSLRPSVIAAMRKFVESTTDHPAKLRTALDLIELGETGLDEALKSAMTALPTGDMHNLGSHYVQPALEYLQKADVVWTSEWVASQVAAGKLYPPEHWLRFATAIPGAVVDSYLRRLETDDLKNARFNGLTEVVAAAADAPLAARVFIKLGELRSKVEAEPDTRHELEQQIIHQLEAVFRAFPDQVAASGILTAVTPGDPLDIKMAADILSRVGSATFDKAPLQLENEETKRQLRDYLKASVDVVLRTDNFGQQQMANLSGSIARLGHVEDMADLVRLIRGGLEKERESRGVGYGNWHLEAVMQLGSGEADHVLVELVPEYEYSFIVPELIGRQFQPKPERALDRTFRYDLMWEARVGRLSTRADAERRSRVAAALTKEIQRLLVERTEAKEVGPIKFRLVRLANALAAVDSAGSSEIVLEVISLPDRSDEYSRVEAAERLLVGGVVLPTTVVFGLLDSLLASTEKWMDDQQKYLLKRILVLCAFVDDPEKGITRMRDVLAEKRKRYYGHELGEIVTALGESRCAAAVNVLTELAADPLTFEQCEDEFINAFAKLDTASAREFLIGLVNPAGSRVVLKRRPFRGDVFVARLKALAEREPSVAMQLCELCERDHPQLNRHVLSQVLDSLGTPQSRAANLLLLDDSKPIPDGVWSQLEAAFVERRPGDAPNVFREHARASNELRERLFAMANEDVRRRKSAFTLLGRIEEWRLEHGRPVGEPRHPDFSSGRPWPPKES